MYKPSTLKDIANGLGLAVSTVSRALSDSYEISDKTKKRVIEKAANLNYKRNSIAFSLKSAKNYSIGVVISSVDNTFFSQVIDGIESVAYNKGYHVIITQSHESAIREAENIKHLTENRVDGMLISLAADSSDYQHIQDFQMKGSPMVFFDRVLNGADAHKVVSDNEKGAFEGTSFLIEKGYKKIAFLGTAEHLSIIEQRRLGYEKALKQHGKLINPSLIKYCGFEEDYKSQIESIITDLLSAKQKPDAIFTACERTTFGCLQVLNQLKLTKEIKVVGFSNTVVSHLINPSFHCIKQDAFEMGKIATENLIRIIENNKKHQPYHTVTLDTVMEV